MPSAPAPKTTRASAPAASRFESAVVPGVPSASSSEGGAARPNRAERLREQVARSSDLPAADAGRPGGRSGPCGAPWIDDLVRDAERICREEGANETGDLAEEEGTARPAWRLDEFFGQPLEAAVAESLAPERIRENSNAALAFVNALGKKGLEDVAGTKRDVAQHLEDSGLSQKLAGIIVDRSMTLVRSAAATGEALNDKFAAEGGFEFDFGVKADFFNGLEDRIGAPSADILGAMVNEHCHKVDSAREWTTSNYGITTTSRTELLLVLQDLFDQLENDPSGMGAKSEELEEWQKDVDYLCKLVSGLPWPQSWPPETVNKEHPRSEGRAKTWLKALSELNKELTAAGEKPLLLPEAISLCMYTGPLFEKYNSVCRGGPLRGSSNEIMHKRFMDLCGAGEKQTKGTVEGGLDSTQVNRYTTTIHVLASALIKASKTTKAVTVMRGTTGGRLPKQFWKADASGVKGGIEFGFLSTTTNREVAMQYASDPNRGAGTVLEMQTGMIDKGADLSSFSQYPHERELCFPPLTSMQVLNTAVEGGVLVVSVRLNLNLTSLTIEEVIGKRRKVAADMCKNLQTEASQELVEWDSDLKREILSGLGREYDTICAMSVDSFNEDSKFQDYLRKALELRKATVYAKTLLVEHGAWNLKTEDLKQAVENLRVLLRPSDGEQSAEARAAADRLGELDTRLAEMAALAESVNQLRSDDLVFRKRACQKLGEIPNLEQRIDQESARQAVELLIRIAQDRDEDQEARLAAIKPLWACTSAASDVEFAKPMATLSWLAKEDHDTRVRVTACEALPTWASSSPELANQARTELLQLGADVNDSVRDAAKEALTSETMWRVLAASPALAGQNMAELRERAKSQNWRIRRAACPAWAASAAAAGSSDVSAQALELLKEMVVRDEVIDVRCSALSSSVILGGGPECAELAMPTALQLTKQGWEDRCDACRLLAACGAAAGSGDIARQALELLKEIVNNDENVGVLCSALSSSVILGAGPECAGQAMPGAVQLAKRWSVGDGSSAARSDACRLLAACGAAAEVDSLDRQVGEMMTVLNEDRAKAAAKQEECNAAELAARAQAEEVRKIQEDAGRDLDEAMPALEAGVRALTCLSKKDVVDIKDMKKPPAGVCLTLEVVCIYLQIKPVRKVDPNNPGMKINDYWDVSKKQLLSDPKLMDRLLNFDKDNIPEAVIQKVDAYIERDDFRPEAIKKVSTACVALCMWARAMHTYHKVAKAVAPKRARLANETARLQKSECEVAAARAELQRVVDKLEKLESDYNGAVERQAVAVLLQLVGDREDPLRGASCAPLAALAAATGSPELAGKALAALQEAAQADAGSPAGAEAQRVLESEAGDALARLAGGGEGAERPCES